MKAIYQSKQKYLQLSKGEVNRYVPVMGQAIVNHKYVETGKQVGYVVAEQTAEQRLEFYLFSEGANHNQITLTDSTEIKNMRAYIERRHDKDDPLIKEISFEE